MATANLLQTSVSGGTQNALSLQGDGVFFPKASTTSRLALTLTTTANAVWTPAAVAAYAAAQTPSPTIQ